MSEKVTFKGEHHLTKSLDILHSYIEVKTIEKSVVNCKSSFFYPALALNNDMMIVRL